MYYNIFKVFLVDFLKNKAFIFISLCLPFILIFNILFIENSDVNITIGVLEYDNLEPYLSNINVKKFENEDFLRQSVADGTIDIGYFDNKNGYTQIYLESDFMHNFISYGLFAEIYKQNSKEIAINFLKINEIYISLDDYQENYNYFYDLQNDFDYNLQYIKGSEIVEDDTFKYSVPFQIIMAYLLIFSLSANISKKTMAFSLLSTHLNKKKLEFFILSPVFLITFTIGTICLVLFCKFEIKLFLILIVFQIFLIILNFVLRKFLKIEIILGLIPFFLIILALNII